MALQHQYHANMNSLTRCENVGCFCISNNASIYQNQLAYKIVCNRHKYDLNAGSM